MVRPIIIAASPRAAAFFVGAKVFYRFPRGMGGIWAALYPISPVALVDPHMTHSRIANDRRLLLSFEMKLPLGERAIVDLAKLRDYCLNPAHPRGRHKARVFASALGLKLADAGFLREELLRAAREESATLSGNDEYGERYAICRRFRTRPRRSASDSSQHLDHSPGPPGSPADQLFYTIEVRPCDG